MKAPVPSDLIYRGLLGDITNALKPETEAHPVGVLVSLMTAFSAYIGHGPRIASRSGNMPLAIWGVLCGVTGEGRKGTATNLALKVVQAALPDFRTNDVVPSMPASGLGLLIEVRDRKEKGGDGGGSVLLLEEEADNIVSLAAKDRRFSTNLCKIWDGGSVEYVTAKDEVRISNPHIGVLAHVQPKNWAKAKGSKAASGGAYNRFALFWVQQGQELPVFLTDEEEEAALQRIVDRCGADLRLAATWAKQVKKMEVPRKVRDHFEKHHRKACANLTKGDETLAEFGQRAMAYLLRFASIYALADMRTEIRIEDFDAALALITYSIESTKYVLSANRSYSGRTHIADKAYRILEEAMGPMVNFELGRRLGGSYRKHQVDDALAELGDEVASYRLPPQGKGQPPLWRCLTKYLPDLPNMTFLDLAGNPMDGAPQPPQADPDEIVDAELVDEDESFASESPVERLALVAPGRAKPKTPRAPRRAPEPRETPAAEEVRPTVAAAHSWL